MAINLWKDIPGWEGRYQASPLGHIRSVPHDGRPGVVLRERYLTRKHSKVVDARVNLCRNGEMETYRVGKLVALAWCPGYEPGKQINHIDGNPLNNRASNLEWVTGAENIAHAMRTGLIARQAVVLMRDGKSTFFASYSDAARAIGRNTKYISTRIRRGCWTAIGANGDEYNIIIIADMVAAA